MVRGNSEEWGDPGIDWKNVRGDDPENKRLESMGEYILECSMSRGQVRE